IPSRTCMKSKTRRIECVRRTLTRRCKRHKARQSRREGTPSGGSMLVLHAVRGGSSLPPPAETIRKPCSFGNNPPIGGMGGGNKRPRIGRELQQNHQRAFRRSSHRCTSGGVRGKDPAGAAGRAGGRSP